MQLRTALEALLGHLRGILTSQLATRQSDFPGLEPNRVRELGRPRAGRSTLARVRPVEAPSHADSPRWSGRVVGSDPNRVGAVVCALRMRAWIKGSLLLLFLSSWPSILLAEEVKLGEIECPTSGAPDAMPGFIRGVLFMHSFE